MSFLFEIDAQFADDIDQTIRNQIPEQRKSILRKYGTIYFKAWIASNDQSRQKIEDYLQRYIHEAVHAASIDLFHALRALLLIFFENKRHEGIERMLYKTCSPILWRAVRAANDPVRRQAAVLLFDNFPLRDPDFNNESMDQILQQQFDIAEMLLFDSNPLIRVAAILGVSKILSVYWDLLPESAIQQFIRKLFELANDKSSSAVRAAFFEGLRVVLENHQTHGILKPLLSQLAPLINDCNERVRSEFVLLLVRVKSIRNLHFYHIVSIENLLHRMVLDRGRKLIRTNLILLFLNSYFPLNTNGSSQVARCLALLMKDSDAALVFYRHVVIHTSVSSVCKLAALLFQWISNAYPSIKHTKSSSNVQQSDAANKHEQDENDIVKSSVTRILVLQVIGKLLQSVSIQLQSDTKFQECVSFLQMHFKTDQLLALLKAVERSPMESETLEEGICAIWHIIAYIGHLSSNNVFLETLLSELIRINGASSQRVLGGMVECLVQWKQLDVLGDRIDDCLDRWTLDNFSPSAQYVDASNLAVNPITSLCLIELLFDRVKNPSISRKLCEKMLSRLEECARHLMEMKMEDLKAVCDQNVQSIVKLLDVDAKACFSMAVVAVHDQTPRLKESRKSTQLNEAQVLALQPASLFLPPEHLMCLVQWILKLFSQALGSTSKPKRKRTAISESLYVKVHQPWLVAVHDQTPRLKESRKSTQLNEAQVLALQPASLFLPPEHLMCLVQWILKLFSQALGSTSKPKRKRTAISESLYVKVHQPWRNLLTFVVLLLMESIVFGLQVKPIENDAHPVRLLQALVSEWCEALESIKAFEHIVVYLGHYLLHSVIALSEDPSVKTVISESVEKLHFSLENALKAFPKECASINFKRSQKTNRTS
ncbi:hypothetical protein ABG067_003255 [Albugo candida]